MINFYKGAKNRYSSVDHRRGIYFTTDTHEIITGDEHYGKNADTSIITKDIIVAGGPLADDITNNWPESWKDTDGNKIIPKNTSVENAFEQLFLKTVNGTVTWGEVTWNPYLGTPAVELSSNNSVEVGTKIKCNVTPDYTIYDNVRSCTCEATQGYFDDVKGSHNSGNKTVKVDGISSGDGSLTCKWNDVTLDNFTNNVTELEVVNGTNTFTATQEGITAAVDKLPDTTVYASTNTNQILETVTAPLTDTRPANIELSESGQDTIEGYYKYFIGECDLIKGEGNNITSDLVRGLSKFGAMNTNLISYTATHHNGKGFIVACPATNSLDYIKDDASVYEGGFTLKPMNVKDAGGNNVSYNVYHCNNLSGLDAVYKFFKFK